MAIHFLETELRVTRRLNEKEQNRARFPVLSLVHCASSSLSVLVPSVSSRVSVFELMSLNSLSTLTGGGEPQGLCLGQLTSAETCFDFCLVNVLYSFTIVCSK